MSEEFSIPANLRSALARLGAPADEQLNYLRGLGVEGSLDELALEFDDAYRPLADVVGLRPDRPDVAKLLRQLDSALASDALRWAADDIYSDEWESIRRLARRVQTAMDGGDRPAE
ncbi:hypothetical protein [Microbacterium sp. T2.11-28]|uniref:hypothetical protein n=1 Tax=Microbacterium sp. T2.11-28 TaxID=3041169 RepID=UPI0025405F9C|nr:hypothetical protein [Microbacterium sp. T2.11-28]